MRVLAILLLFIFVAGCSRQKLPRFIPKTFDYPDDSIGEGKTLSKGEQILDVTSDDGTKLGRNKESWIYHNDTLTLAISSESQFVKDTSMLWQARLLPCLVTRSDGKMDVRSKKYASLNYMSTIVYYGYYAKNIGLVKYILAFTDRKNVDHYQRWDLVSIENGAKSNALMK